MSTIIINYSIIIIRNFDGNLWAHEGKLPEERDLVGKCNGLARLMRTVSCLRVKNYWTSAKTEAGSVRQSYYIRYILVISSACFWKTTDY